MHPANGSQSQAVAPRTSEYTPGSASRLRAVILVGHGSLRPNAGAAMIRLAVRAHAIGVAPFVTAGFLNYSRPTFAEALARCLEAGANEVIIQPYFLVPGKFVREDLQPQAEAFQAAHPELLIHMAQPFGDHPALARLVLKRAMEADDRAANAQSVHGDSPRSLDDRARPLYSRDHTGMLIMAHGSPNPKSNKPIYGIAKRVRGSGRYAAVMVCYMDLNKPRIPDAIASMSARGIRHIIAAPCFLQLGNHVLGDLPAIIDEARARHPASTIVLAEHLAYDRLLVDVIADRVAEALHSRQHQALEA